MQSDQGHLQDLTKCTVAIQRSEDGRVLGTGVIVTDDGLILTCYHVIEDIETKTAHETVDIYFPSMPEIKGHAQPIKQYCDPEVDVAFLQLQKKLPEQTTVANLSENIEDGHTFKSYGFRKNQKFDGLNSYGRIDGKTRKKLKENNKLSPELIQLSSDGIDYGMSGAPVLDKDISGVIGIVSEHYRTQSDVDKNLALAIPIEYIIQMYPEIRARNPGLRKFNNFVKALGKSGSSIYNRFEDTYVPPIEYSEIKETLQETRCIFIIGTAEYGKTYTAINLLWEYYNDGSAPKYINEAGASAIIEKLKQADENLKNTIIYLEDPVGRIEYERNLEFEESIGSIIDSLGYLNVRLIITMRDQIYEKFNPLGKEDLKQYIKKLDINSYDYERRKEMLLRWAKVLNCNWIHDGNLKRTVLEFIKNEAKLPTPLNIKNFAMQTTKNKNIKNEKDLLDLVDEQSKRTPERFARDITEIEKSGEKYKIIFLCFLFISRVFSVDFVKSEYNKLLQIFDINDNYAFRKVSIDFQDKLEFSQYVGFSHPSYYEALSYILLDKYKIPTKINTEIFSNVLLKLADNKEAANDVASTVYYNFDKLPENVRNKLLFKLAVSKEAAWYVASAVAFNFKELPDDVRKLLFKLAEGIETAVSVAYAISFNFINLPEDVRNLLFKMADNKETAECVASFAVHYNFDKLPENVRNELLLKLADNNGSGAVANAVFYNFDKLPEDVRNQLLLKLADNEEAAKSISESVHNHFAKLPEDLRNELLLKLVEIKEGVEGVNRELYYNFDKLPEDVRNQLLLKLADRNEGYGIIISNFDRLPANVQDLLFKLADNEEAARGMANVISSNFDKLPKNIRNELLLKLADRKEAAGSISLILLDPVKLPVDLRGKLLLKLADNKDAAYDVIENLDIAIFNDFEKLPMGIISELLIKLADNKETAEIVAHAVSSNFDKLPENIQNLLFTLADDKKAAVTVAYAISNNFDKLPETVRNELLLKLADNEGAASNLAYAVSSNFDKLPEVVRNGLLLKLADNKEAASHIASAVASNFDKLPKNIQNLLFRLVDNNKATAQSVASPIAHNYDKLPESVQNLLFKLADNKDTAGAVADAISFNFINLPEDVRNLLFKMADNKESAGYIANALSISWYFDKLPKEIRNELLLKLANNKEIAGAVAYIISTNFDKLPESVQNLLFELADNKETASYLDKVIDYHFKAYNRNRLPEDIRNELLVKLAGNKDTVGSVSKAIIYNFDKLPENVQNLLVKMVGNIETARDLAKALVSQSPLANRYPNPILFTFGMLPENIRVELLLKLAEYKEIADDIVKVLSTNIYYQLPKNVRNKLLTRARENEN